MKKLFWEIFPKNRTSWKRYFDWCLYNSKTFKPLRKILNIIGTVLLFIFKTSVYLALVLMFPITRAELRIRSNKVKKMEDIIND